MGEEVHHPSQWGYPHPRSGWGEGTAIQGQDGGTPIRRLDGLILPIKTGWGYHPPQEWMLIQES